MFQQSEIVSLVLAVMFLMPTVILFRAVTVPHIRMVFVAIFFAMGATIFTVVEGVLWESFFNLLEHLCYTLSAVSFALACWLLVRDLRERAD